MKALRLVPAAAAAVLLGLALGCAAASDAILRDAVSDAGLPYEVEGFRVAVGSLRGPVAMFYYVRETQPTDVWVCRFVRSPSEQRPEAFTDLDALLRTVARDKEGFRVEETTWLLTGAVRPVKTAYYSWQEEDHRHRGCFCVWETPEEGLVFALNCTGNEKPDAGLVERLLAACGAE